MPVKSCNLNNDIMNLVSRVIWPQQILKYLFYYLSDKILDQYSSIGICI